MSAVDVKLKSNDSAQSELGNRLLKAVQIVCEQAGETPAGFIDWLTNEGGLTKMVLLYFTKHLTSQNAAFGIACHASQAAPTDWLIEENSVYRLNAQGHHCDEITIGMANGSCEQIAQNLAAQKLYEILTRGCIVPDDHQPVPVIPTDALLRPFQECPSDALEMAWTEMIAITRLAA
jgi:hypothetical protein